MKVIRYDEIDSTNLCAKRTGNEGVSSDTLFIADKQTAGTGRRGRSWESPAGDNIYMSLLLKPDLNPAKAPMLTLVMALAVVAGLQKVLDNQSISQDFQIKWPNDIVLNKKKVCGILTEMALEGTGIKYVVIGVGINVNQMQFLEELNGKATSLAKELSKEFDRDVIIDKVVESFYYYYEKFLATEDLSALKEIYNQMLVNQDKEVVIHEPGNEYHARAIGINEQGELIVETVDGRQQNIYAGEVSVRGIYGYV